MTTSKEIRIYVPPSVHRAIVRLGKSEGRLVGAQAARLVVEAMEARKAAKEAAK